MAISSKRYVDITSGVGGAAVVSARELILRLFTSNPLVPEGTVLEMTAAEDAASYFGISSPEYARALFYFGFLNKQAGRPRKISFARYADATAAHIYGVTRHVTVAQFQEEIGWSLNLTLGEHTTDLSDLTFGTAATLSDVASIIQASIRSVTAGGPIWTGATVVYNAPALRFELTGGDVGAAPVATAAPTTGVDIRMLMGWDAFAIFSPGAAAQEPVEALIASNAISDNFGSFAFIPTISDIAQIEAVAAQNDTYNVKYIYLHRMLAADAPALYATLSGYSGVACVLSPLDDEFPELLPAALLASTDYSRRAAVQNYMFYQAAGLTASVEDDSTATLMDNYRVNYYGVTQKAGRLIAFFQRGVMMGLATDPVDLNIYANEMWLKDAIDAQMLNLLLSESRIPANDSGRATVLGVVQEKIEQAVTNGVVSVGKDLNYDQKAFITAQTGDPVAWVQVQNLGYWKDCAMQSYLTPDARTEWKAVYTLIYSKDDAIRKVEGTHNLI